MPSGSDDDNGAPVIDPPRIVHVIERDTGTMRVVVEMRRSRRLFDASLPIDVTDAEVTGLLAEVMRLVRIRRTHKGTTS
jgi:hypothetical protein